MNISDARVFNVAELLQDHEKFIDGWYQFLKVPSLRSGIYVLPVGTTDTQEPHQEDEIYYVLSGKGKLHVAGVEVQELEAVDGQVLFVKAGAQHHFHSISQDLKLLVFFSSKIA